MNTRLKSILALTFLTTMAAVTNTRAAEKQNTIRVFYFGNSLTGSAMPDFHEELGKSAGKQWICDVFLRARVGSPGNIATSCGGPWAGRSMPRRRARRAAAI